MKKKLARKLNKAPDMKASIAEFMERISGGKKLN